MSELAKVEIEDDIATITLDDGKANALGFTMIEHINKALDEAEACADVIVLRGREGVMTAGFDLKVMRNEPDRVMDPNDSLKLYTEYLRRGCILALPYLIY